MLKPLTFSVSLAVALGACSLGLAGHHDSPSGQCPSPQGVVPSPQGWDTCGDVCAPPRKHRLCDLFKHREKCYTYEWVLKKKRCGGLFGHHKGGDCGGYDSCTSCGDVITPSAQWPTPQGHYAAPQAYGAGQMGAYGAGQMGSYGAGQMAPAGGAPAGGPAGDAVGPAPEAAPPDTADPADNASASNRSLLFLAPAGN